MVIFTHQLVIDLVYKQCDWSTMNLRPEITEKSQEIYKGKYISLRRDEVTVSNGRKTIREVVGHPGAVAIVPITKNRKIILVRQYRYAAEKVLLEVPAGTLEIAEDPKLAAIRELREETGFSAKNLKYLTGFWTAPGFCSEFIHGYLATELIEDPLSPDEDEFIETEEVDIDNVAELIRCGEIQDSKSISCLLTTILIL